MAPCLPEPVQLPLYAHPQNSTPVAGGNESEGGYFVRPPPLSERGSGSKLDLCEAVQGPCRRPAGLHVRSFDHSSCEPGGVLKFGECNCVFKVE